MMQEYVRGFSKKSKAEKIDWLLSSGGISDKALARSILNGYLNADEALQQRHDEFSENVVSNYYLPYAVAPNFLINGRLRVIPMVVEESSVVAAACRSANFWYDKGGFLAEVLGVRKTGHVHFNFTGDKRRLFDFFEGIKPKLMASLSDLEAGMRRRGAGTVDVQLVDKTDALKGYYQLCGVFETADAMGANFINSCLERLADVFRAEAISYEDFGGIYPEVTMSILSNYTPDCLVRVQASCPVDLLAQEGYSGQAFAERFVQAVKIAEVEPYRAVTHNKGLMNGVDAVVLATANDFRAIEAGVHAYASGKGVYTSLTHADIAGGQFVFYAELPINVGTIGGVTALHPLAKLSLEIMGTPDAKELMGIIGVAGLAQNFAAVRSLVTTGIQKGHMKMHLSNMLTQLGATDKEKQAVMAQFKDKTPSHRQAALALENLRNSSLKE